MSVGFLCSSCRSVLLAFVGKKVGKVALSCHADFFIYILWPFLFSTG